MGWGEKFRSHVDVPAPLWDAATNLAKRVADWNKSRATGDEERMVVALSIYQKAMADASTEGETGRPSGW